MQQWRIGLNLVKLDKKYPFYTLGSYKVIMIWEEIFELKRKINHRWKQKPTAYHFSFTFKLFSLQ